MLVALTRQGIEQSYRHTTDGIGGQFALFGVPIQKDDRGTAIMTLVIFAIMLTSRIGDATVLQNNRQGLMSFSILALFNAFFIGSVLKTSWHLNPAALAANVDAGVLGTAFMNEYIFPFEIISVVLLVALVGAIILGRADQ